MINLSRTRPAPIPLLVLAANLGAGILVSKYSGLESRSVLIGCGFAVGVLAFISLSPRARELAATGCVMLAFFVTGVALTVSLNRHRAVMLISQMVSDQPDPVELTATIQGQPEPAPQSFYLALQAERMRVRGFESAAAGNVLLLVPVASELIRAEYEALDLRHGARIRVLVTLDREDDFRNPGVTPYTEYLERSGFDATGVVKSPLLIERLDDDHVFVPMAWLYDWRGRLQKDFAQLFSPETAGVLDAALLGNRYNISSAAGERLRAGGTFHVLVISGFQIAIVGGLVLVLVRSLTRRRSLQFVGACVFLWSYTIAVGAEASVVRSAVMFTMLALAPVVMRRPHTLNSLGGAAIALLAWHPDDLFDPSFQLTFLSVLAIVTIAVPIVARMKATGEWRPTHATPYPPDCARWFRSLSEALFWRERAWRAEMAGASIQYRLFKNRWALRLERCHLQGALRYATVAVIVSASVQIGMLPVLIIYFHRLSPAALLLNIFAGLALAALSLIALIAVLVSHFNLAASGPLVWLVEQIEWLLVHCVDPFTRLGLTTLRLPHYHGGGVLVYVIYFLLLIFLVFALAQWQPLKSPLIASRPVFRPTQIRLAAAAFAVAIVVIVFHPFSAAGTDRNLRIDYLDVGQGDCALVTMPDGTTVMIDGGGRPRFDLKPSNDEEEEPFKRDSRSIGERVVSEFLWARGLDQIDYVLATHADADHIDGLNDIVRNFRVRGAIVARTPVADAEFSRFASTLVETGVPVQQVGAGDVFRIGDVSMEVIWPAPRNDPRAVYGNNDGLVLRLSFGEQQFLFTGDIEAPAEIALLKREGNLSSDVVKVAHHGSRTSSSPAFVNATRAQLAIVPVGRRSMFGHPHKEVIERWQAAGATVMTTGDQGTITIETDGRALNVRTFVK